jgi:type II secretory pathway component PulK
MVSVRRAGPRSGYALLATLWICVGVGALAALISVSSREAIGAARNRVALTSAMWLAQACLTYARETVRDAMSRSSDPAIWDHIDRVLAEARAPVSGCSISARAVGARLDVNASDEATLSRLFQAAGWRTSRADSAAAAIADWMDADDQPRAGGAEREWYLARHRIPPSNSPFVDARELRRVRGLEDWDRLDSLLDVTPGPLAINQAPAELLLLLPGFTDHTVQEVLATRSQTGVTSFLQLRAWLDPAEPDASAKLPGLVVLSSAAWIVTVRTRAGFPLVTAVIEARFARAASTSSIGLRRSWIE